jgi:hypothetical protein
MKRTIIPLLLISAIKVSAQDWPNLKLHRRLRLMHTKPLLALKSYGIAAVNRNNNACDIFCRIGYQVKHRACNIIRLA